MLPITNKFDICNFDIERDIQAYLRLRQEIDAVDGSGPTLDEASLRQQLVLPGHNPALDRWVVEEVRKPGVLVGSALVWVQPESNVAQISIAVHPQSRRHGLGGALMERVVRRAKELGANTLSIYTAEHPAGSAFLKAHGFQELGAYTEMRAALGAEIPLPAWPLGYQVLTYDQDQNIRTLTEAMNHSYEGLWGHNEVSVEQMGNWLPGFVWEGLFLLFAPDGSVIGISRTEPNPERSGVNGAPTGYIDAPGIAPELRSPDLYRALLLTGMRWLQSQGSTLIELESWGDSGETLDLYKEYGFQVIRRVVQYTARI